jgi:hypothetical protein
LGDQGLAPRRRDGREDVLALGDPGLDGRGLWRVQVLDPRLAEVIDEPVRQREVVDVHRPSVASRSVIFCRGDHGVATTDRVEKY